MTRLKSWLIALSALLLIAPSAMAKDYPFGGITPEEMAAELIAAGHAVTETGMDRGTPFLNVTFNKDGIERSYQVYMLDCAAGRCASIQYCLIMKNPNGDRVWAWNAEKRFARAYGKDGHVLIEYDIDVERGANSVAVENTVRRFEGIAVTVYSYFE